MDEVPCVYIVYCAELKAIYVGSRGASQYHTRRWAKKLSVQGGRCLLHLIKEHIRKMRWVRRIEGLPRGAGWSAARMYSLMSRVGIEWWGFIPWIWTSPDACYRCEMFWIRRTPVPLNTLRPHKGAPAFSQLLRGGLVPPEKFDAQFRSQVQREIDCQHSSLPAKRILSLLVHATDRVPKLLWNQLFDILRLHLKRETPNSKVNIKRSIMVRLPVPTEEILQPISDLVSHIVANAPIQKSLKQYYNSRIIPCASRTPYVSRLLSDLGTDITPSTLHARLHADSPCSSFHDVLRPAPIGHIAIRPHDPPIVALYPKSLATGHSVTVHA